MTDSAPPMAWARLATRPGFRTFGSPGFRRIIGALVIGAGLVYLAILLVAVDRAGAFEVDFVHAYRRASLELLAGHSPYVPEQLAQPFPANGRYGWYLYPPAFAQVLTPFALLPEAVAALLWLAFQGAMLFGATWFGASAGGATRSLDRAIWTAIAVLFFLPVHEVLWTGNMGGPLALAAAMLLAGGVAPDRGASGARWRSAAGILTGALAVFKLSPIAWLPAAVRAGNGLARGAFLGAAALTTASVVLAPQAWLDYVRVLANLLAGDVRYANNLAPAIVALNLGVPTPLVDLIRFGAIVAAVGLVGLSAWFARKPGAWPAAVAFAILASLLLPAALWYHYLVLFLPLAAFAWVRAAISTRLALVGGGVLVSLGMTMPLLAAAGELVMAVTILATLWPRGGGQGEAPAGFAAGVAS